MKFELWQSDSEESYLYIPRDENYQNRIAQHREITKDLNLIWSCEAKSYFVAMKERNRYLGYSEYKPPANEKDIEYG